MYAASSGDSSRKSAASPTFQPFDSSFFLFDSRIVVFRQSSFAGVDDTFRSLRCLLSEHLGDNDRVRVNPANYSPRFIFIIDSQLVTPWPYRGHSSGVRHAQRLAFLQTAEEKTRFQPSSG
jgi:hypothetical protein